MSATFYYTRDGEPTDLDGFCRIVESGETVVEQTEIGTHVMVSTIFLGIDQSLGTPPPILFETLIMGGPHSYETTRYTTEAEAREGHARVVAAVRADMGVPS